MTKQQIYKIAAELRLRLNTIRDRIAHMNHRLALRFPQKIKLFGDPIWLALLTCLAIALGLTSCNVTRTITTQSQYMQRGDTSVVIQTKTVETYDASKKL